jgi:hypothetical protein
MKTLLKVALLLAGASALLNAQLNIEFAGSKNALTFAYGLPQIAGFPALQVSTGNGATGSGTITLVTGAAVASNGAALYPLNINAPITVGIGANAETVTPTAISNCNLPSSQVYQCQVTATFNNLHGAQEPVTTGTYGLQEAINRANGQGGGTVIIDASWAAAGGTNAIITAATGFPSVSITDNRYHNLAPYWTYQPTTLTQISAPTTLTNTTVTFTATPVGTWGTSAYYFCITYVDALGGESPCSASYTQTPGTTAYSLNITSPAASTGAVGWRAYGGITATTSAYLLATTATNCTLTTLENVIPACAIGSNGVWPTLYVSTTALSPAAIGVTNTNNPVPQSHTTFGYQPSGSQSYGFQTNYGPFGTGTISSATAGDTTVLGSVQLPAGYLNYIGRTVRFTGKIIGGATATGTLAINVGVVWAGGVTAGAPVAVCIPTTTSVLGTQTYTIPFSCTMTTNAVGATAVGSVQADSWFIAAAAGTTNIVGSDTGTAAVGSLGLFSQDTVYVYLTPATEAITAARLMDLHIESIQ